MFDLPANPNKGCQCCTACFHFSLMFLSVLQVVPKAHEIVTVAPQPMMNITWRAIELEQSNASCGHLVFVVWQ